MDKEGRQLVHVHQQLWWAEQSLAHSVCSQDKARGGPSTETSATLCTGCLSLHHVSLRRKELPKGRLPVSPPQPDRTGFAEPTLPPLRYAELSPKHTSVKAKHSLLGEGRLANYPLRCSQPWLAKAAPEAFDTNLLWQSICAVSRSSLQGNASSPAGHVLGEGATSAAMPSEGLPPSGK